MKPTKQEMLLAFLDDLTDLCCRHGMYLDGRLPGGISVEAMSELDEKYGYVVHPDAETAGIGTVVEWVRQGRDA